MKWRKANETDLENMGSKHWRDAKLKETISIGAAYRWVKMGTVEVEVLDETLEPTRQGAEEVLDKLILELTGNIQTSNETLYLNGMMPWSEAEDKIKSALQSFSAQSEGADWVSVGEGLPESPGEVLGCVDGTNDIYVCYYRPDRGFQVWGLGRKEPITDMKITHWRKLPAPPKA